MDIDLNELWIGDRLKLNSSGREGTYEGMDDSGKALVKIGAKLITASASDLELIIQPEIDLSATPDIEEALEEMNADIWKNFSSILDLHLEVLLNDKPDFKPRDPLVYQVEICRKFLKKAIEKRLGRVIIIHGKGDGTLKAEIESLINSFPESGLVLDIHDGGAKEVHFKSAGF